jgi:rhamnogalacturonyl hydrolase YesR
MKCYEQTRKGEAQELPGTIDLIKESISKVEKWVEDHDYMGYEPFDGLSSFLRPLTFNNMFAERILQQIVRQSPLNLRPLLGIKPKESTKGRGYMAWGYLTMMKVAGEQEYKEKAIHCLEWLIKNKSPKHNHYSWGNHYDFTGRGGLYSKFEPIIVWTALIGQAFLDAYEGLHEERYLDVAKGICSWIRDLPIEKTESGTCISYFSFKQSSVHNSNMLGAAMLARTGRIINNDKYMDVASQAMQYSCSRQLPSGAWYYGEDPKYHWIDNFHTGYNLDSLKCYIESAGDKCYEDNLRRGFGFFKNTFFEANGRPKYYHNRVYPVDSQCASQAIETLSAFSEYDEASLPLALKVAKWTIQNMQDKSGYFYYRRYPLIKAKTPMLHWGQATTYKALALLLSKLCK